MVPGIIKGDGVNEIKDTKWENVKEFYADRVLNIIEDYAPKTKEKISGESQNKSKNGKMLHANNLR